MKTKLRVLSAMLLIPILISQAVSAESIRTLTVEYEAHQSQARELFEKINEWRTSGDAWYWESDDTTKHQCGVLDGFTYDYGLEQYALQRACEVAVSFSHTRPDGDLCHISGYAMAENIAANYCDAESCFILFREDDKDYSGQGHRRNMCNTYYTNVGIGCVKYCGVTFWAIEFGPKNTKTPATSPIDGAYEGRVTIDTDVARTYLSPGKRWENYIHYGDTKELPQIKGFYSFSDTWRTYGAPIPEEEVTEGRWSSEDLSVIRINSNNTMTAVNPGDCIIKYTARIAGKEYTYSSSIHVNKLIIGFGYESVIGNECSYTMPEDIYYEACPVKPKPVIKYKDYTLVEGKDYEITKYVGNVNANVTSYLEVTGKGIFTGTGRCYFTIKQRDVSDCTVVDTPVVYNGRYTQPDIKLYLNGNLVNDSEYYVKNSVNVKLGEQKVTIRAWGYNLKGNLETTYTVVPNSIDNLTVAAIPDMNYTGDYQFPELDVRCDGKKVYAFDYSVDYSDNIDVGTATVTISSTRYEGTKTVTFKIIPAALDDVKIRFDRDSYAYTGDAIKPAITVYEGSTLLVNGKDYTVSYSNNTDIGVGKVTITGKGNYKGTTTATFPITDEPVTYSWKKLGGKWYYIGSDGSVMTGFADIGGKTYYFDDSGVMLTKWQKIGGYWYYFASSGAMKTGWQKISKVWYFFDDSGVMATGLHQIGSKTYYFKNSGAMTAKKWVKISGDWYRFKSDGSMAVSETLKISGKTYKFDADGVCLNP